VDKEMAQHAGEVVLLREDVNSAAGAQYFSGAVYFGEYYWVMMLFKLKTFVWTFS